MNWVASIWGSDFSTWLIILLNLWTAHWKKCVQKKKYAVYYEMDLKPKVRVSNPLYNALRISFLRSSLQGELGFQTHIIRHYVFLHIMEMSRRRFVEKNFEPNFWVGKNFLTRHSGLIFILYFGMHHCSITLHTPKNSVWAIATTFNASSKTPQTFNYSTFYRFDKLE